MESDNERRARARRLEREYAAAPQAYRLRLGALAALGYLGFGLALVCSVGLSLLLLAALFWRPWQDIQILIPLIVLGASALVLVAAARLRIAPPQGYTLRPGEGEALCAEVERIRAALGAPRLHGIVLDERLNAAAAFVPRGHGLLPTRHYLVLGLPLLQLLDAREAAAVIAHEFGHFHHRDGRFPAWIYQLRARLASALEGMHASVATSGLMVLLLRWFHREFDARSQVVARQQELVADQVAAAQVAAEPLIRGLVRVQLASDQVDHVFWPEVRRSALSQSYPPALLPQRLGDLMARERERDGQVPAWLLHEPVDACDSHPPLAERMRALAVPATLRLQREGASAAELWLDESLCARVQDQLGRAWQAERKDEWEQLHRQHQRDEQRLQALEANAEKSAADWLEQAELSELHRPGADVADLYRQGLALWPGQAAGHHRLGQWLLQQARAEEATDSLERAALLDASLLATTVALLERDEAVQADAALAQRAAWLRERWVTAVAGPAAGDAPAFAAHSWDEEHLSGLRRALAGIPQIHAAWLLRDTRAGASALPHHVLLVDWRGSVASETAQLPRLLRQLPAPGTLAVRSTTGRSAELDLLRAHAGEPIHQRH